MDRDALTAAAIIVFGIILVMVGICAMLSLRDALRQSGGGFIANDNIAMRDFARIMARYGGPVGVVAGLACIIFPTLSILGMGI